MKLLQCAEMANEILSNVKEFVAAREQYNKPKLSLTVFSNPQDSASQVYLRNKEKVCSECGIQFYEKECNAYLNSTEVQRHAYQNKNGAYIVQMPCNERGEQIGIVWSSEYDADGLSGTTLGQLYAAKHYRDVPRNLALPCTPLGLLYVIKKQYGEDLSGKRAVIINRSNLVGKPIAKMLMDENCTVTICHSKSGTERIQTCCQEADIIVCAVGRVNYLDTKFLKPLEQQTNQVLILDVGINHNEAGKLCGDVNVDDLANKTNDNIIVTTVPKGIGVMTTAMLAHNVCVIAGMKPWYQSNK